MSAADRPAGSAPTASDVAAACRDAGFARLVATADGDALAATGVIARALAERARPFQASVAEPPADLTRSTEADLTIALGRTDATADLSIPPGTTAISEVAFDAAGELGVAPDPLLALAGATAAPVEPGGDLLEAATAAGVRQRPGVAVPTADLTEGLAVASVLTPVLVSFAASAGVPLAPVAMIEAVALNAYFFPYQSAVMVAILGLDVVDTVELTRMATVCTIATLGLLVPIQIAVFALFF